MEWIVFVSGAVVMILELTGSRILAPQLGGSLPVWTALIGIILGSLSVGYYFGGKIADKNPSYSLLAKILLFCSILLGTIPLLSKIILPTISTLSPDIRLNAVVAAGFLFVLPSVLLGTISPYVLRLKLHSVQTSGATAGRLYALSTIGSIFGTFLAGFVLFAFFSSQAILYVLSVTMLILACITAGRHFLKTLLSFLPFLLIVVTGELVYYKLLPQPLLDTDTLYNRVTIVENDRYDGLHPVREMIINNERSSAIFIDSDEIVYQYVKYFQLADHFVPHPKHGLMIGGAGYSYPRIFIEKHPEAKLDVVEIDPALTELAMKYFFFKPNNNTTIYHEDARTFLNREEKQYDAIFNDAFSAYYTHPFQLSTKEAVMHLYNMLTPDGVIISNMISAITEERGKILRAQYHTYKSVFPYVYVFPVSADNGAVVQNVMVIAAKKKLDLTSEDATFAGLLGTYWKGDIPQDVAIFTDEYAPIEYYSLNLIY